MQVYPDIGGGGHHAGVDLAAGGVPGDQTGPAVVDVPVGEPPAQNGEAEAFGQIYDRYLDTVFRYIYFRVGSRTMAEDLTSDVFLRALKGIGNFKWQGRDIGAWLVTIARNIMADYYKSGRYRLEVTGGDVVSIIAGDSIERGPEGNPAKAAIDHITNVTLLSAVKMLTSDQQECIVLRFIQGFSVAETARAMGKNVGALKALQYRALRNLAKILPDDLQPGAAP